MYQNQETRAFERMFQDSIQGNKLQARAVSSLNREHFNKKNYNLQ